MTPIPDAKITEGIQKRLGLRGVQQLQQELVEGLRNANPQGYPALRALFEFMRSAVEQEE